MGPEATAEFYLRVIRLFQKKYGCVNDSDYPEMFIYNLPLPDVVNSTSRLNIQKYLKYGLKVLEQAGSKCIVSPCNTANTYFYCIKSRVPIINIIDETIKLVDSKVGIIGIKQTILSKIYQKKIRKKGCEYILPNTRELQIITNIIMNILSGKKLSNDRLALLKIIKRFKKEKCKGVMLACTELPLIISQKDTNLKVLDTLQILAESTVRYSKGENNEWQ